MKQICKLVGIILACICLFSSTVSAASAYNNYTYSDSKAKQKEPQAVYAKGTLTGDMLGVGDLNAPSDMYLRDGKIYIADTGNNRIVICNTNGSEATVINDFISDGKTDNFNSPTGVFVTEDGFIYVCDKENNRIVVLDNMGNLINIFGRPDTKLLSKDIVYKPKRCSVDSAGRIFVVAENVNLGIIELNKYGEFVGFFGAIEVQYNAYEYFLKAIATDEQKEGMSVTVPTEYSSLDIDSRGFVFATVNVFDSNNFREDIFIRKLNPLGNDILMRNGYTAPMGDAVYKTDNETRQKLTSSFVDVKADEANIYSALDDRYGRIFTYNKQGYLMYVFGGIGDSLGQFHTPVALEVSGNEYFVLDQYTNRIVLFETTEYGSLFKQAVVAFDNRNYDLADECWNKALKYTGKSQVVYDQIGKSLLKNGDHDAAANFFLISKNREDYSASYEEIRAQFIDRWFTTGLIIILVVIAVVFVIKTVKKIRGRKAGGEA